MHTNKLYSHLTKEERFFIEMSLNHRESIRSIAFKLQRSASTISREIKRNLNSLGFYISSLAEKKKDRRIFNKYSFKWHEYKEFSKLFKERYDKRISGVETTHQKIKSEYPNIKIPSVKQIYNWINSNKWIITKKDRLRRYYKKGRKRQIGIFSQMKAKYRLPIWTRPNKINDRSEFGHWEIDLVIGKRAGGHANLLVLTERKTRFNVITKVKNKNPYYIVGVLKNLVKQYNLDVKSITSDNGFEFKGLGLFGYWHKIKTYYCEPYASHQRGSNENANGIIRRFYKKGTDFNSVSRLKIELMMDDINNMPRKMFNWESSVQMYSLEL